MTRIALATYAKLETLNDDDRLLVPALAAPAWNQLNDPLPDNQQDPYATTDCGEESTAMAIRARQQKILRMARGPHGSAAIVGIGRSVLVKAIQSINMLPLRALIAPKGQKFWDSHSFGLGGGNSRAVTGSLKPTRL